MSRNNAPSIQLYFSGKDSPELVEFSFRDALGQTTTVTRGKDADRYAYEGTFQWTSAVKALTLLCIGTRLNNSFALSGRHGTPAASLDFAIAKRVRWLAEMFGVGGDGKLRILKLIKRVNSELRRPGALSISLNSPFHEADAIQIFLEEKSLSAAHELSSLFEKVEGLFNKNEQNSASKPAPDSIFTKELLSEMERETLRQLSHLPRCSALSLKQRPSFLKKSKIWNKAVAEVVAELEAHALPHQSNFPTLDESLQKQLTSLDSLRTRTPPSALGGLVIFTHLERKMGMNITFSFDAISSTDRWKRRNDADAIVLSWRGASQASDDLRENFEAVSLLPQTRFDLIGDSGGDVLVAPEPGGYPLELYDTLLSQGILAADSKPEPASILEIVHFTGENSHAGIVAFPYSEILSKRKNLPIHSNTDLPLTMGDYILFISRSWGSFEERNLLFLAIRHAWHALLNDRRKAAETTALLLGNKDFLQSLRTTAGLYQEY